MKKYLLALFILVALLQLSVPAKMAWEKENTMHSGKAFRFKVAPIDPNDPFRGKYVYLRFDLSGKEFKMKNIYNHKETIYAAIKESPDGFADIAFVSNKIPVSTPYYIKAKVRMTYSDDNTIAVEFPFDKFYMEEYKAPQADIVYQSASRDTNQVAYAIVNVLNGESALIDVIVNDESITNIKVPGR